MGKVIVTLLIPLLAAIWLRFVISRKSEANPVSQPYSPFSRALTYLIGFVIASLVSVYLGLYLYGMYTGHAAMNSTVALTGTWVSYASLYIGGLWGGLMPYRMLAREGKRSIWTWLLLALLYAFLFYLLTEFTR